MPIVRPRTMVRPVGFAAIRAGAGVKIGGLVPSGSISATTGQSIVGKSFAGGQVFVGGGVENVTIQNCHFTGDGSEYYAVQCESGSVTIEDCTFDGNYLDSAVYYSNVTMRRCEIVGMRADGVKVGPNSVYEENWIHDLNPAVGAHSDGMQIFEKVGGVVIRSNVIEVGQGGPWNADDALDESTNSALILNESIDSGTPGTVSVTWNLIAGGGFSVYFNMRDCDTTFANNEFTRDAYRWGPLDDSANANSWFGNTFSDNGDLLNMPG